MVLFETPSGFAIFSFDGVRLLLPDAMEGIECLFNDAVMELMCGLKNLIHSLVPEERLPLSREDRLQMSQGLKTLLNRYGFDVKPEMVSDNIIQTACVLYDCDKANKLVSKPLHQGGNILKDVSGIDTHGWSLMKLATALKMICFPGEKIVAGDPEEMFSKDVLSKLDKDAHKYKGKMKNGVCLRVYDELLASNRLRTQTVEQLRSCVKKAEKEYQNEEVGALRSWGLEPPSKRLRRHK